MGFFVPSMKTSHVLSLLVLLLVVVLYSAPKIEPPTVEVAPPSADAVEPELVVQRRVSSMDSSPQEGGSDRDFNGDSEESFLNAILPVSTPLQSLVIETESPDNTSNVHRNPADSLMLFQSREAVVNSLKTAVEIARRHPNKYAYRSAVSSSTTIITTSGPNSSAISPSTVFPWDIQTHVMATTMVEDREPHTLRSTAHSACVAVVMLSRPKDTLYDKYRPMVNEGDLWQEWIAESAGPDAFRVVARSDRVVEMGATVLEDSEGDVNEGPTTNTTSPTTSRSVKYMAVVQLAEYGNYSLEVEHVHRAFGAFTDVDRKGGHCPLPPASAGRSRRPPRVIEFDNRIPDAQRLVAKHILECTPPSPIANHSVYPRPDRPVLPLCHEFVSASDMLSGSFVHDAATVQVQNDRRRFEVVGGDFHWEPRHCSLRRFSSRHEVGSLLSLFRSVKQRVLFLGDSQMRTLVNAFVSVLLNEPAAENDRTEYRKMITIPSLNSTTDDAFSSMEFLWDPQGELVAQFHLIMNRDVKRFERRLTSFVKKKLRFNLVSSMDAGRSRRDRKHTVTQLPLSHFSPEGVSLLRAWKFWKEGKPNMVVIGFGGWNMWLCESFAEAEDRLRETAAIVRQLIAFGTTVVFVGWPSPIDSNQVIGSKRRMTSARIGVLMELTRLELAAAGAVTIPFFEMSFALPHLSSKASASHFDNTTILYSVTDCIGTLLQSRADAKAKPEVQRRRPR